MKECYQTLIKIKEEFELEISVDESEIPTSPLHHIFIVEFLRFQGVSFTSLALKFSKGLEKAVDYIGDKEEFEKFYSQHAQISSYFGGYKLSLHSGSDKFSLYPILKRHSSAFHVKTSGTSWLQALKVIADKDSELFKEILLTAFNSFEKDKLSYHISLKKDNLPDVEKISPSQFSSLFSSPPIRQILHVTYGSLLSKFGEEILSLLSLYEEEFYTLVALHLDRHLRLLFSKTYSSSHS